MREKVIKMNLDTTTTFGKSVKTLGWIALSGAIAYVLAFFSKNPDFWNPMVVGVINVALVAVKNLVDPKVKNL